MSGVAKGVLEIDDRSQPHPPFAQGLTLGKDGAKAGQAGPRKTGQAKDDRPTQQSTLNCGGGREGGGTADQGRETPTPLVC